MIIGIDPGFTGAIAFLEIDVLDQCHLMIKDMPLKKIMGRNQVDSVKLACDFKIAKEQYPDALAIVEDVHAMPEQGVTSTFRFGYNAGILLGVLQALDIKVLRAKPAVWKPALGLSRDKARSLRLARILFSDYTSYFERRKDDGRAEAALLAYFAYECL